MAVAAAAAAESEPQVGAAGGAEPQQVWGAGREDVMAHHREAGAAPPHRREAGAGSHRREAGVGPHRREAGVGREEELSGRVGAAEARLCLPWAVEAEGPECTRWSGLVEAEGPECIRWSGRAEAEGPECTRWSGPAEAEGRECIRCGVAADLPCTHPRQEAARPGAAAGPGAAAWRRARQTHAMNAMSR
jgi:hypothetical protein